MNVATTKARDDDDDDDGVISLIVFSRAVIYALRVCVCVHDVDEAGIVASLKANTRIYID